MIIQLHESQTHPAAGGGVAVICESPDQGVSLYCQVGQWLRTGWMNTALFWSCRKTKKSCRIDGRVISELLQ